jgi:hypothetical protein
MTNPTGTDMAATAVGQGRDGGDQHPDDAILDPDHPEVQAVLDGLTTDTSDVQEG